MSKSCWWKQAWIIVGPDKVVLRNRVGNSSGSSLTKSMVKYLPFVGYLLLEMPDLERHGQVKHEVLGTKGFTPRHHPHPGNKGQHGRGSLLASWIFASWIFETMRCCNKTINLPLQSVEVIFSTGQHIQAEFSNVGSYAVLAIHLLAWLRKQVLIAVVMWSAWAKPCMQRERDPVYS